LAAFEARDTEALLRWKRVRKSLKSLRDPKAFARGQRELAALQKQEDQGKIALYYFDEAGFALDPTIPYAWQEPKSVIELPAMRYGGSMCEGFSIATMTCMPLCLNNPSTLAW